jgi:hypothetical protein
MPFLRALPQMRGLKGLTIGVARETEEGERRVVITPANVPQLTKKGAAVSVARGAGVSAGFSDAAFAKAGATLVCNVRGGKPVSRCQWACWIPRT